MANDYRKYGYNKQEHTFINHIILLFVDISV